MKNEKGNLKISWRKAKGETEMVGAGRPGISSQVLKEKNYHSGVLSPVKYISRRIREVPNKAEKVYIHLLDLCYRKY